MWNDRVQLVSQAAGVSAPTIMQLRFLPSRAKTASYSKADLETLNLFAVRTAGVLDFAPPRPDLIPTNKNFHYWFDPVTIERLATLKGLILEEKDPVRTLLMVVFSSIIVRVSYQGQRYTLFSKIEESERRRGECCLSLAPWLTRSRASLAR